MTAGHLFDIKFLSFYQPLHEKYTEWQKTLALKRIDRTKVLNESKNGAGYSDQMKFSDWASEFAKLQFPSSAKWLNPKFPEMPEKFDIQLPPWCYDQRNQMTGPADDAALVVKMMNSGAPGVMVDLEDSQANNWTNTARAYTNLYKLFQGELSYKKKDQEVKVNTDMPTVLWIRPRGLHMTQVLRFPASLSRVETSASLLDVCVTAFNFKPNNLPCKEQPLTFYIPKSEYAEEALWWSELFKDIAKARGWDPSYIKCMALVESHSLAYQMEEFIWNLKDHILGLNLGRWDYMASLIEQNMWDPTRILPDRNSIPHDVEFFQVLRKRLVNVCHSHGILAIGGMTALYPSRQDAELNERALKVLKADKENEAAMGMDGAWTGHPDQNQISIDAFPEPNQLEFIHEDLPEKPDLRPWSDMEDSVVSEEGTRQSIRAAIRYRNGVLNGRGASLLDGYMEDLATDRICRLMITQRMNHLADHDFPFVHQWFDEELARLLEEGGEAGTEETLRKARVLTEQYVLDGPHNPQ